MGLSNAEKQAAWRSRQAANKSRVAELEAEVARLKAEVARLTAERGGGNHVATRPQPPEQEFRPPPPHARKRKKATPEAQAWFLANLDEARKERQEKPKRELARLKQAMADAHPDKGGDAETFLKARAAYVKARNK